MHAKLSKKSTNTSNVSSRNKQTNSGPKTNSRMNGIIRQPKDILKCNVWPALPVQTKSVSSSLNKSNPALQIPEAKSYVCISVDQLSDKKVSENSDISALLKRVAELETSYANLIDMYKTQIKINDVLGSNISILATYCLLAMDKRMNSYAPMIPLMIQPCDQKNAGEIGKSLVRILERDDGTIIASMLERQMYAPLVESIFSALHTKQLYRNSRFAENAKTIISNISWNLLVNGAGVHIIDAISARVNDMRCNPDIWQDLYTYTVSRRPVN